MEKNILLSLMLTSCISFGSTSTSTSTSTRKTFYTIGGEKFEEKELEIDENSYKLADTIELGKRNIYKIYKDDQKDIIDKIFDNIINNIKGIQEESERIKNELCAQLDKDNFYVKFEDGSKGPIKEFIEEKIEFICEGLKPAMFKYNSSKEEADTLFSEAFGKASIKNQRVADVIIKLFSEAHTPFAAYQRIKNYFPVEIDEDFKDSIFEAIELRDYKEVSDILENNREYFEEMVNGFLNILEKEKFIALKDKIVSNMFNITLGYQSRGFVGIYNNIDTLLGFREDKKVCYKGIPLILRKYIKK